MLLSVFSLGVLVFYIFFYCFFVCIIFCCFTVTFLGDREKPSIVELLSNFQVDYITGLLLKNWQKCLRHAKIVLVSCGNSHFYDSCVQKCGSLASTKYVKVKVPSRFSISLGMSFVPTA